MAHDGLTVYAAGGNVVRSWQAASGSIVLTLESSEAAPCTALAICRDQSAALVGASNGLLTMWDLQTGEAGSFQGHKGDVVGASFVNDDQHAVTVGQKGTVSVWHVETGARVTSFVVEDDLAGDVKAIGCTSTGSSLQLVVGCESGLLIPMTVTVPAHGRYEQHGVMSSQMSLVDSTLQRNRTTHSE